MQGWFTVFILPPLLSWVYAHVQHLCNEPFGNWHPWGSWRRRREFVGSIDYGIRFLLWNPEVHSKFNATFNDIVFILLLCKPRGGCPMSLMSEDLVFYILNMCRHDWFADTPPKPSRIRAAAEAMLVNRRGNMGPFSRRLAAALQKGAQISRSITSAFVI